MKNGLLWDYIIKIYNRRIIFNFEIKMIKIQLILKWNKFKDGIITVKENV